MLVHGYDLFVM